MSEELKPCRRTPDVVKNSEGERVTEEAAPEIKAAKLHTHILSRSNEKGNHHEK